MLRRLSAGTMQLHPSRLLDLLAQNLRRSLLGLRKNLLRNRFLPNCIQLSQRDCCDWDAVAASRESAGFRSPRRRLTGAVSFNLRHSDEMPLQDLGCSGVS